MYKFILNPIPSKRQFIAAIRLIAALRRHLFMLTFIPILVACGGTTDNADSLSTTSASSNQLDTQPIINKSAGGRSPDPITRSPAPKASSPVPTNATPSSTNTSNPFPVVNAPSLPLNNKTIDSPPTPPPIPAPVDANTELGLFHEGPIPAQFDLSRNIAPDTSNLKAINPSNPVYTGYFTDGVNAFRVLSSEGNNVLYPVLSRFYNGFDEYQLVPELFGAYQDWSSMTLLSPAAPTVASYVTLKNQIIRYESDFLDNRLDLDTRTVFKNAKSLRFLAVKPTAPLSLTKASIDNENLLIRKDSLVSITAWFFIASGTPTGLIDFECGLMNESPGIRLLLNEQLEPRVEMKWGNKTTYRVPATVNGQIPRNAWTKIRLNLYITDNSNGAVQLYVNDRLKIDARGQTLSDANIIYNRLQMGITANAANSNAVIYMDEVNYNSTQK